MKDGLYPLLRFCQRGIVIQRKIPKLRIESKVLRRVLRIENIPVIIHTAEPQEFFSPVDNHNERWLELNIFTSRQSPPSVYPTFEQLMKERDHMFSKHPKTRFIGAHRA